MTFSNMKADKARSSSDKNPHKILFIYKHLDASGAKGCSSSYS